MVLTMIWLTLGLVLGFVLGRMWVLSRAANCEWAGTHAEPEDGVAEEIQERDVLVTREQAVAGRDALRSRLRESDKRYEKRGYEKKGRKVWTIGSPVLGQVIAGNDVGQAMVVLVPDENKLYAPAGGKVKRLYPLGNAILFVTEFGAVLHIQVGEGEDELLGGFFRPRVIENEVVNKGKLLLEFDREGLIKEGEKVEVVIRVENYNLGSCVKMIADGYVKSGEEILEVAEWIVTGVRP